MKAVLNIKGTKLSVLAFRRTETGKLQSVYAKEENGPETHFVDKSDSQYYSNPHVALENLEGALEYPELEARIVEERTKLIQHLEITLNRENRKLQDVLDEMGEIKVEFPCEDLGEKLVAKQSEFHFKRERVLGNLDMLEEVKAYTEGFYVNVDDPAIEA